VQSSDYQRWLATARRLSRRKEEAEDLLQASLLVALESGRAVEDRWFHGVLRNQAALMGRTAARRRRRESRIPPASPERPEGGSRRALEGLPRGARIVAVLVLHGMNAEEIQQALELAPTAFRQRLTSIRKALGDRSDDLRQEAMARAYQRRSADLDFGLLRRELLAHVRRLSGLGTHDPDGHLIVIRKSASQIDPPRQQEGQC
jgi:RNA polymerase sigma-70 factor (ECF subfamily)